MPSALAKANGSRAANDVATSIVASALDRCKRRQVHAANMRRSNNPARSSRARELCVHIRMTPCTASQRGSVTTRPLKAGMSGSCRRRRNPPIRAGTSCWSRRGSCAAMPSFAHSTHNVTASCAGVVAPLARATAMLTQQYKPSSCWHSLRHQLELISYSVTLQPRAQQQPVAVGACGFIARQTAWLRGVELPPGLRR